MPDSNKAAASDIALILQDMADGVMVLKKDGAIAYLNNRAMEILGVGEDALKQKVAALFMMDDENDHFIQAILDAVYNKGMKQKQLLPFQHSGSRRILEMSSTYLMEQSELILVFTDVTEREALIKRHHDSAVFVSALFTLVCVSVLLHECLELFIPGVIAPNVFTVILEVIAAILVFIVYRINGYTLRDVNLGFTGFKKYLPLVLGSTGAFLLTMAGIKVVMLALGVNIFGEDAPFINFANWNMSSTLYPITVLYQEIMSRAIAQNRLKDVFQGERQVILSILISSLIFAAIHIAYGFPMMMGAFLLLSVFGFLYEKLGNVWLLCIVHYAVGTVGNLLGFL